MKARLKMILSVEVKRAEGLRQIRKALKDFSKGVIKF